MDRTALYQDMMERTQGDVYLGVVGPVRTGKSTFIKRFAELFMLPNLEDENVKARLIDELPQSGTGRSIMTTQPKFVPNEAVEMKLDDTMTARIRLIDCVGYMVPGAIGSEEEGEARMVTTPWFDEDIPFERAAEIGTQKVIEDHATVGIVVLTDGTITELSREQYQEAEAKCMETVQRTGKPYIVLLNTTDPSGDIAQKAAEEIRNQYGIVPFVADLLHLSERSLTALLAEILYAFPLKLIELNGPSFFTALASDHPILASLTETLCTVLKDVHCMRDARKVEDALSGLEVFSQVSTQNLDLGTGKASIGMQTKEGVFYSILSDACGASIQNDFELMSAVTDFVRAKQAYDRLSGALEMATQTGYGIVEPDPQRIEIDAPEVFHTGTKYGVRLHAKASGLHMIRVDLESDIQPLFGTEQQCNDFLEYLEQTDQEDQAYLKTSIFGRSLHDLILESLQSKGGSMNDQVRMKLQSAIQKIANDGCNGMICIML